MIFTPAPPNPFPEFIATYFARCRAAFPRILAIAGKWRFEDLVPGLSDFDTRFVVDAGMAPEDWAAMSRAVGDVHANLVRERPEWARILEHTPGVNLALDELDDPLHDSPQIYAWTWYGTSNDAARRGIEKRQSRWGPAEELYHLKKFGQYWGPYQRGIDPPINLGAFENKYALHSRYMHYFAPAVHSAVSIYFRNNICGKLESLRLARTTFPSPGVVDELLAAISTHYEVADLYGDKSLMDLETRLAGYLNEVFPLLVPQVSLADLGRVTSAADLRSVLGGIAVDPAVQLVEKATFMRLMVGRLLFFSQQIPGFDSEWLIRNELARLGEWSCRQPLTAFVSARSGRSVGFEDAIELLTGQFLSKDEAAAFRDVATLSTSTLVEGEERLRAKAIAERFEHVQLSLDRLGREPGIRRRLREPEHESRERVR